MDTDKMIRVSKSNPCPVCGKPDWCLVAPDGVAAICQRISEGAVKLCGQAGWLHIMQDRSPVYKLKKCEMRLIPSWPLYRQWDSLSVFYQKCISSNDCFQCAISLGVSEQSLDQLDIGLCEHGYTFPMRDGAQRIVGIQVRRFDLGKMCIKGSRLGLFIHRDFGKGDFAMICEGLSDTAAALDLGFSDAVGRPSCMTGRNDLVQLCCGRRVVIVGDNDPPGQKGAESLAWKLALYCPEVKVIYPPYRYKDLREWKRNGVTGEKVRGVILNAPVWKINIQLGEPS
jgi:hypothetical protein